VLPALAIRVTLKAPPSHAAAAFLSTHGATARRTPAQCSTCHTQENCLACHAANPRIVAAIPRGGPGRSPGVAITRKPPPSHTAAFREGHGTIAAATPATCAGCHARSQCLDCHRPTAAAAVRSYHPAGFLERHPASAYARETSCQDCHNTGAFCAACHARAGLSTKVPLGAGYHDAKRLFLAGHGVAARQSLETCVTCHAERDCLACHGSVGGRRFNPHGPGFNAALLKKKNPEMCTACHGTNIPG
jgi:predicted CXXCH cytochrome family protein